MTTSRRRLIGRSLSALLLAPALGPPSRAQGGSQAAASGAAAGAGKREADSQDSSDGGRSPADLLKSRNLRRSGTFYVLGAEAEVQRKLSLARKQLAQFRRAAAQQRSFEGGIRNRKIFESQLIEQRAVLNRRLAEVDRQTPSLEAAQYNPSVNAVRNELVDQHNQLAALINESNDRLRLLYNQGDESELKQQAAQEVAGYRESYMQSVIDARRLIDEAQESYKALAQDAEVSRAIHDLGGAAKVQLKLGPSREFTASVAGFEKIEKAVLSENVDLRKQGGVYWVDVTFNGKVTRPMVFDTGAGVSTLSSALAAEIGLKPKPGDPTIKCQTADGSIVEARQMTIDSMRVGKFTVKNVVCAVMPPDKGDVDPLLGQTFHRHFTYRFTPDSGRLTLSQIEEDPAGTPASPSARKYGSAKSKKRSRGRVRNLPDFPVDSESAPLETEVQSEPD